MEVRAISTVKVYPYKDKDTGEVESVDSLIRRFKKQVLSADIIYECKKRESFAKKTLKRKLKSDEAKRRQKNKKHR
jgi:small subunit ribosomal protein S21